MFYIPLLTCAVGQWRNVSKIRAGDSRIFSPSFHPVLPESTNAITPSRSGWIVASWSYFRQKWHLVPAAHEPGLLEDTNHKILRTPSGRKYGRGLSAPTSQRVGVFFPRPACGMLHDGSISDFYGMFFIARGG